MESKIILNAETGQAVKNVRELQDTIKQYKKDLQDENATAEENRATARELANAQAVLRDVMNSASDAAVANAKQIDVQKASYNSLVHAMADLTKEWRATTDMTERAQLGKKIDEINDQLKKLDASKGSFMRNVGNYGNELGKAFTAVGSSIGGPVVQSINMANGALKMLSKNPIMLILVGLVSILEAVKKNLDSNEEAVNAVQASMANLAPIGDLITKVLQGLGKVIAWVAEGLGKLVNAIVGESEAMATHQKIVQDEIKLRKAQREATIKNAEAERDIAKLKADAAEKDKLTNAQRIALLEQAAEKEREIAERAMEDAKLAYEIQKAKNSLTESSAEEKQKEADAYAALVKAETDYYKKVKETNSQVAEARKKMADDDKKARKEQRDAVKAQMQAEKELIEATIEVTLKGSEEELRLRKEKLEKEKAIAVADAKAKITDKTILEKTLNNITLKYQKEEQALSRSHEKELEAIRVQGLTNRANQYARGTMEYLQAMKVVRKQELDDIQREEGETLESYNARRLQAQKNYYDAIRAINEKGTEQALIPLKQAYADSNHSTEQTLAYQMNLAEATMNNLLKMEGETAEEYAIRQAEAQHNYALAQEAFLDYQDQKERQAIENRMVGLEQGSVEYLQEAINLRQFELDTLHQMEEESDEEFYARKLQIEQNYIDAKKALAMKQVALTQQAASAVSGILGSLADIYESDSEATEEELKKAKNMRIAGATIDMLSGVVSAISTAMQLGPIAGPILGAINSAAVIAAGVANIAKIKQQNTSRNSSGSTSTPAQVTAPSVDTSIQQVHTLTSASEEERLNQMADQKVYLVTSELEAHENDRKVQLQEATF